MDVGAAYGRYSNNLSAIRTPSFDELWSRISSIKEYMEIISTRKSALAREYELSQSDNFYAKWIDAYIAVYVQDNTIEDILPFISYQNVSV